MSFGLKQFINFKQTKLYFMKFIRIVFFFFITPAILFAQDNNSQARQIFEEVDQRRAAVTYEQAQMDMIIYNNKGQTRKRTIQSFSYNEDEVRKSLLIFKEPANVAGTGFLTLSEGEKEVQKLYLPALERIRIISASEQSDRFMGSDFTYEDLGDQNPSDYNFSLEAETDTAFVLRAEKKARSQYDHLFFYIHPEKYTLQQAEYFNEQNEMVKKLVAENYQQINERLWEPQKMTMYDLQNDRKTELYWENRTTGEIIPQWRFTERGLRRGL